MPGLQHERIAAGVIIALSLVYLVVAQDYRFGSSGHPGPGFFPVVLAVLGLGLATVSLLRGGTAARLEWDRRSLLFVVALVLFAISIETLGFIVAGVPFTAFLVWLLGSRSAAQVAAVGVAAPVLLYLIFDRGFSIALPKGLLAWIL